MQAMLELLKNPEVMKLVTGTSIASAIIGGLLKKYAPILRGVLKTEHQLADEAIVRALKTPQKDDDIAAQSKLVWIRRAEGLLAQGKEDALKRE